jgi:hypothetical protein
VIHRRCSIPPRRRASAAISLTRRLIPIPGARSTPDGAILFTHAQQAMGALWFLGTLGADQLRFTQSCTITNQSCSRRTEHHRTRRNGRLPAVPSRPAHQRRCNPKHPNRTHPQSPDPSSGAPATGDPHRRDLRPGPQAVSAKGGQVGAYRMILAPGSTDAQGWTPRKGRRCRRRQTPSPGEGHHGH